MTTPVPTLAEIIRRATQTLTPITETPRLDAELLLAHAMRLTRAQLLARLRDARPAPPEFDTFLHRRLNHEPIAYITGTWEFFSLEFSVRPPILVPRPETEHLVETALEFLNAQPPSQSPRRALDLCTGTGCVAIAIAKNAPQCRITATDINPGAIALATENAQRHHADVAFHQGDLFQALPPGTPCFGLITANPPYVEDGEWPALSPVIRLHEDSRALLAGPDGLDIIRRIIHTAPQHLAPGGLLALEMGETQAEPITALLASHGYTGIRVLQDLARLPRIIHAIRPA